jgi:hypothetical protein
MNKMYRRGIDTLMEYLDLGPTVALSVLLVSSSIIITSIIFFVKSAPPKMLTISSGPEGSIFHGTAKKYAALLEKNGIKVKVLESAGSLENLARISDPKSGVDLGLVQSGSEDERSRIEDIISLGAISYQPLFFFYRGAPITQLTEMKGKTLAIGAKGSGSRKLALKILKLNGIKEGPNLVTFKSKDTGRALMDKKVDGAFIMGEAASVETLRELLYSPGINLFNYKTAQAYVRKINLLHLIELPQGVLSIENNLPREDVTLVGPMVELIAHRELHPALSDMILDAATEIHGPASIFRKRGEFPMAVENKIEFSEDAARFYKSGKGLLYRYLPFWLASLLNRILVVFLPMLIVLVPAVRSVPAVFKWIGHLRIRRRYRALLRLEKKYMNEKNPQQLQDLLDQFKEIEDEVRRMKVSAALADQFYSLRSHIDYVRKLMSGGAKA